MKRIVCLLLLVLSAAGACAAADEESSLVAFADRSEAGIGDKIKFTLEVIYPEAARVDFPVAGTDLSGFAVRDFGTEEAKKAGKGKLKTTHWFVLDTYTAGSYVINPQKVTVQYPDGSSKNLESKEVFVEVKSSLKDGGQGGLKDIKGPISLASAWFVWILAAAAVLSLAAWVIIYRFWKSRRAVTTVPPPLPAHEWALAELSRIHNEDLIAKGKWKEHYYQVSHCLRSYIEKRFGLKATEETTEEFMASLMRSDRFEGKTVNLLKAYLEHCDLVKFARMTPTQAQADDLWRTTRDFIESTREVPVESAGVPQGAVV